MLYKIVENGKITMIGNSNTLPNGAIEITEEKYNALMNVIKTAPSDTLETKYELSDSTEQYKQRETTHAEKVEWYFNAYMEGTPLEEIPLEYQSEVETLIPQEEDQEQALINSIIAEVAGDE